MIRQRGYSGGYFREDMMAGVKIDLKAGQNSRNGLTAARIKDLKADCGKTRIVFDPMLPGFGVRVEPSGVKAYIVEFRAPGSGRHGQKRRQTIGRVDKIALDDARRAARMRFGDLAGGRDLHKEAVESKRAETFAQVAVQFLEHKQLKRKSITYYGYKTIIAKHLTPTFGRMKLKFITRADVRRLHERIASEGGTPVAANRAVAVLSAIWNFAARDELVDFGANPVKGIERIREQPRERFLTDDEISRLLDALDLGETSGLPWAPARDLPPEKAKHQPLTRITRMSPHITGAIRLLLLTGARLREILGLRWTEIDADRGIAFLPDSKTGRKPLMLNEAALAEIERLRKIKENDFVVGGGTEGRPRADLRKPWEAVVRAAELGGVRLHDLRHTAASLALASGHSLAAIGRVLGQSQTATTARYAHVSRGAAHAAAEAIGEAVTAARLRRRPVA